MAIRTALFDLFPLFLLIANSLATPRAQNTADPAKEACKQIPADPAAWPDPSCWQTLEMATWLANAIPNFQSTNVCSKDADWSECILGAAPQEGSCDRRENNNCPIIQPLPRQEIPVEQWLGTYSIWFLTDYMYHLQKHLFDQWMPEYEKTHNLNLASAPPGTVISNFLTYLSGDTMPWAQDTMLHSLDKVVAARLVQEPSGTNPAALLQSLPHTAFTNLEVFRELADGGKLLHSPLPPL